MRFSAYHLLVLAMAVPGCMLQVAKVARLHDSALLTSSARFDELFMVGVWIAIIVTTLIAARASPKRRGRLESDSESARQTPDARTLARSGAVFALAFQKRPIMAVLVLLLAASLPVGLILLAYGWDALATRRELWLIAGFVELAPLLIIWHTFRAARRMRQK